MQMAVTPAGPARWMAQLLAPIMGRPIVPIACAFALGIQCASSWRWAAPALLACACAATLAGLYAAQAKAGMRSRPWAIAGILCAFAAAGAFRLMATWGPAPSDVTRVMPEGHVVLRGVVAGDVDMKPKVYTCPLEVQFAALPGGTPIACTGRVALRLPRDASKPPPGFGDTLEVRGILSRPPSERNPGGFDYAAYLAHRGIYALVNVRRPNGWKRLPVAIGWGYWLPNFASRCRMSLLASMGRVLPKAEAGLAAGILLGVRTDLPPQLDDDFVATGTVHVLATAGLHVGIVAMLIVGLLRLARLPLRAAAAAAILCLTVYAVMAGARPSVLRATVMAAVFLFGIVIDRESDVPAALAASALFLLLLEPNYLFDAGFQLSFATVACITALMPLFEAGIRRTTEAFSRAPGQAGSFAARAAKTAAEVVAVSTGAQLGSAPITAQYFNMVSLAGIPANACIVPLLALVFVAGFCVWLLSLLWMPAAQMASKALLSPVLTYLVGTAHAFARMPGASIAMPSPGWPLLTSYYAILLLTTALLRTPRTDTSAHP